MRPGLGTILRFSLQRTWLPAWLLPWGLMIGLTYAKVYAGLPLTKQSAEFIAPAILGTALVITLYRLIRKPCPWLAWLSLLIFSFFCREWHFAGTEKGIYLAILALLLFAWLRYELLATQLGATPVITLLSTVFWCYFVSNGLDKHWWIFLPGEKHADWQRVEEYIELTGHLLLVFLALSRATTDSPLKAPR